ncbi:nudC domain-containing protein 1 [Microplitis mediator]|uniref:nudC domain-containing protein 1 n=1 Tax=Microplitis mediator TaxID=375433 RepID=UPI0025542029|nr:nudC domain-containing protein 1 [Microplitis mediator]
MTKIIELRPKKNLLNNKFEKYQFSPDIISITEQIDLSNHVKHKEPSSDQDSWLAAKLFAFHNHLFKNPYDSSCWFWDENYQVWQLKDDGTLNQIKTTEPSFVNDSCKFNPTIAFADDGIVVLSRGDTTVEIIMINFESKSLEIQNIEPGILLDARYVEEKNLLIISMYTIVTIDGKKHSKLVLLSYKFKNTENLSDGIEIYQKQELTMKGPIEYAFIEPNGEYINLLSQDPAKFTYDSLKSIQDKDCNEVNKNNDIKIPKYSWSQDEESVTVWVKIPQKYTGIKPKVKVSATEISVLIEDEILINGEVPFCLDHDLATWNCENDTLKLELMKQETGQMWNELIKNNTDGQCLPNDVLASEIHSRLAHLCSDQQSNSRDQPAIGFNSEQLEECDLEGDENTLQRINLTNHMTTHLTILTPHNRILFTHKLKTCQVLCVRYNHDGCVWESIDKDAEWELVHKDVFPGFGYVEASKTNKKFCISPCNRSYVAIIGHKKRGLLYEKPQQNALVAKQKIIDIGVDSTAILGAVATDNFIILLTQDKLYKLNVS